MTHIRNRSLNSLNSLNSIKSSNLIVNKLNLTSRILSNSFRKSKSKILVNDSIKSDSSNLIIEKTCSLNEIEIKNDEFNVNKKVRRIRNDIAKCFEDVKGFCGKMKESLGLVYLDKWDDYLENLDKIERIQRFYRNWIRKSRDFKGAGEEMRQGGESEMKSGWLARNKIVKNKNFGKLVLKRFFNH